MDMPRSRKQQHLPFDVESWYSILAVSPSLTFPTTFLDFPPTAAAAVVASYRARYCGDAEPSAEAEAELDRVQHALDISLASPDFADGAFVRLSSRSPKDGEPLHGAGAALRSAYLAARAARVASTMAALGCSDNAPGLLANAQFLAVADVTAPLLRVTSGAEAMALILSSERVFADMLLALDCADDGCWATQVDGTAVQAGISMTSAPLFGAP